MCLRLAARHLLLYLPLLAGLAAGAQAQTMPTLKVRIPAVTEGKAGTITFILSQTSSSNINFYVSSMVVPSCSNLRPQGTSSASSSDYSFTSTSVTFASGETTKTVSFTAVDDNNIESTEVFFLVINQLSPRTEATIDPTTPPDITQGNLSPFYYWFTRIEDNDKPEISIAAKSTSAVPEGGNVEFTLTANPAPAANLTVADAPNAKFLSFTPGARTLTITAGRTTTDLNLITRGGNSETTDEPSGNVTVTVNSGTGMSSSNSSATVEVIDNDPTRVTLTTPDATATEGSSSNTANLVLTLGRKRRARESLQVPLVFSGGAVGTDFTLSVSADPGGITERQHNGHRGG